MGWALLGVVVTGLLGWIWLRRSSTQFVSKPPVPPGCMGWPVVGETLEIFSNGLLNKWTDFYATRAAKYGEVRRAHYDHHHGEYRSSIPRGVLYQENPLKYYFKRLFFFFCFFNRTPIGVWVGEVQRICTMNTDLFNSDWTKFFKLY